MGKDLPIAFKPTYVNMTLPLETLSLQEFIDGHHINLEAMEQLLGQEMDMNRISKFRVADSESKHWV